MKAHSRSLFRSASLATLASICITLTGHAASLTWDGNAATAPNPNGGIGTWIVNSGLTWWNGTANVVWPALGGTDDDAIFGNTAGTVTLGSAITANDLTFNTTGYILSGAQTLTLNGGTTPTITTLSGVTATMGQNTALVLAGSASLIKAGAGTLTLNGSAVNTLTGGVTISGGVLNLDFGYLATPTNLINSGNTRTLSGGSLSLVAQNNVTSSQTFNGLTLNSGANSLRATSTGTGAMNVVLGAITRNPGAVFNAILPTAGTISATGIFGPWASTGSGTSTQYLTLIDGNFAALTGTPATTAANLTDTTGAVNYDLAGATGTVQASMSANTIRYTGGAATTAPGATSFSVNGLMNAGTGLWTIGTSAITIGADKDLVVNTANSDIKISGVIKDNAGGASSLIKTGTGTLTISAAPTYTGNTTITGGILSYTKGEYYLAATAAPATMEISDSGKFQQIDGYWFNVGWGTGTATLNVKDNGNLSSQYFLMARVANSHGVVNLSGGSITVGSGNPSYIGYVGTATWNQTGGTATFGNQIKVGFGNSPATISVSGGSFTQTAGSDLFLGYGTGLATLNLTNNGSVNLQHLQMSVGASSQSVINLDGGTLKIGGVGLDVGSGNGIFNFNGGVLQAGSDTTVASTRLTTIVKSGGAIIDTQGYTLTVNSALIAGTGNGGLTKLGSGTLALTETSSYSGPTVISQGILRLTPSANLPAGLKIMPMGDSITYGSGGSNAGYRGPLAALLAAKSTGFQFVGSSTLNPGSLTVGRINHDGHPSANVQYLADNLDGFNDENRHYGAAWSNTGGYWLSGGNNTGRSALYPDIVTLMVGANDVAYIAGAQDRLDALIAKLTSMRPDAKVILADITPRTTYTTEVAIYNSYVNAVAAKYRSLGKNVTLLDLNSAFPSGGLNDGVHPNDTGYNWMANQWNNAILALYPGIAGGLPATSNVFIATGASLDVNGAITTIGALTGNGGVTLGNGGQLTLTSVTGSPSTFSGVISGAGNLALTGGGTQEFTGPNTYSGATTISGGKLAANNTTGSGTGTGSVTVQTNGTLSGNGAISGATTIGSTGVLAPGNNNVATLNFADNVTLDIGSTYAVEVSSNNLSDKIILGNHTLAANGSIAIMAVGHSFAAGDSYDIADAATISGTPTISPSTPGNGLAWDTSTFLTEGVIKVVSSLPADPYADWADTGGYNLTGPAAAKDADPDGDGVTNLLEFATAGDPTRATSGPRCYALVQIVGSDNALTYTVAVRKDATPGFVPNGSQQTATKDLMVYTVEGSNDLATWNLVSVSEVTGSDATAVQTALGSKLTTPTLDAVNYEWHTFRTDGGTAMDPNDFIRLKVTQTP